MERNRWHETPFSEKLRAASAARGRRPIKRVFVTGNQERLEINGHGNRQVLVTSNGPRNKRHVAVFRGTDNGSEQAARYLKSMGFPPMRSLSDEVPTVRIQGRSKKAR